MSLTRDLIAQLRRRLGEDSPMPERRPASNVPRPPDRIFPKERTGGGYAEAAAQHTTALVGIGNVGTRYATDVVLQFQAELAVAHEAVATVLPDGWAEQHGLLPLKSQVTSHRQFLLRPDLGRRLDERSLQTLRSRAQRGVDVQPILADGLSAVACMGSGMDALQALTRECEARGMSVGTPMCAQFARVWLQDEIGETVNAKVAIIILGERPGLGTGDGLSAYMVYEPRIGKTDGNRNMISNIHARGTLPEVAARRLAMLAQAMIAQGTSGVDLDLEAASSELASELGTGYREPQERVRLVEVTP